MAPVPSLLLTPNSPFTLSLSSSLPLPSSPDALRPASSLGVRQPSSPRSPGRTATIAASRAKQNQMLSASSMSPFTLRFLPPDPRAHLRSPSRSRPSSAQAMARTGTFSRGGASETLEVQFLSSYFHKYNASNRASILFSVVIWALFIINDVNKNAHSQRNEFVATITLRSADCLIGILCYFALASRWLVLRHTAYHSLYEQSLMWVGMMTFGLSQILFGVWQSNTLDPTYSMFMILIPSMSPTFFHQRFIFTLSFSISLISLFVILTVACDAYTSVNGLVTTIVGVTMANALFSLFAYRREKQIREDFLSARQLAVDESKSQALLNNMMPPSAIQKLRAGAEYIYNRHENVTVLFSHIVDFDSLTGRVPPLGLVTFLNQLFSRFDHLTDELGVYKVETIGDVFLVCSNCPVDYERADHAQIMCVMAMAMREAAKEVRVEDGSEVQLKLGIHSGEIIAGVVGAKYPRFRLMGDTVNTASRMSTTCIADYVQLSPTTFALVAGEKDVQGELAFVCRDRGQIPIKGKGMMNTHFLLSHTYPYTPHNGMATRRRNLYPAREESALTRVEVGEAGAGDGLEAAIRSRAAKIKKFGAMGSHSPESTADWDVDDDDDAGAGSRVGSTGGVSRRGSTDGKVSAKATEASPEDSTAGLDRPRASLSLPEPPTGVCDAAEPPTAASIAEAPGQTASTPAVAEAAPAGTEAAVDGFPAPPADIPPVPPVILSVVEQSLPTASSSSSTHRTEAPRSLHPSLTDGISLMAASTTASCPTHPHSSRHPSFNPSEVSQAPLPSPAEPLPEVVATTKKQIRFDEPYTPSPAEAPRRLDVAIPIPNVEDRDTAEKILITAANDRLKVDKLFKLGTTQSIMRPKGRRPADYLTQRFITEPELEQQFHAYTIRKNARNSRFWVLFCVIAFIPLSVYETLVNLSLAVDSFTIQTESWVLRVVGILLGLLYTYCSYQSFYERWMQPITAALLCVEGMLFTYMAIVYNDYQSSYGIGILLILLCILHMFVHLRFVHALVSSTTILIFYVIASYIYNGNVPGVILMVLAGNLMYLESNYWSEFLSRQDFIRRLKRENEKVRTQQFLDNMLPPLVLTMIKAGNIVAQQHANADVIFCDIVSFTTIASGIPPEDVVAVLNVMFSTYDALSTRYAVYKVETIGDCWMGCCGVVSHEKNHSQNIVDFALAMQKSTRGFRVQTGPPDGAKAATGVESARSVESSDRKDAAPRLTVGHRLTRSSISLMMRTGGVQVSSHSRQVTSTADLARNAPGSEVSSVLDLARTRTLDSAASQATSAASGHPLVVRIGIHSGPVIAGVVGRKCARYHLFGETVTAAEEMEQHGLPGKVVISEATRQSMLGGMGPEAVAGYELECIEPLVRSDAGTGRSMLRFVVRRSRAGGKGVKGTPGTVTRKASMTGKEVGSPAGSPVLHRGSIVKAGKRVPLDVLV